MRILCWVVIAVLAASVCAGAARAEKRIALVIGNAAYTGVAPLRNPVNDATDLTASLKQLGFEVLGGTDLDQAAMRAEIRKFSAALRGADVGLFFFAGHGLEVSNQNFLIPTDAAIEAEGDLDFQAVPLDLVFRQMTREARTTLIFLDACRDNPMAEKLARSMGARSVAVGRGLARVESGLGSYIAFATEPGKIALDGDGRNSPFTAALLKHIAAEGRDVSSMMIAVRNDVLKETGGKQLPWDHSALTGQFFFKAAAPVPPAAPVPQPEQDFSALTKRLQLAEELLAKLAGAKPDPEPDPQPAIAPGPAAEKAAQPEAQAAAAAPADPNSGGAAAQPENSVPPSEPVAVAKDPAPAPAPSVPEPAQVESPPGQQDIAAIAPLAAPDPPQRETERPADETEHAAIAPDPAPVAKPEIAGAPITRCDELVKIDNARLTEAISGNTGVDLLELWMIEGGSPIDAAKECERAAEQYPDEKRLKLRLAIAHKKHTYAYTRFGGPTASPRNAGPNSVDLSSLEDMTDPAYAAQGDNILKSLSSEAYPEAALLTGGAAAASGASAPMNADGLLMLAGAQNDAPASHIRRIILLKRADRLGAAAAGKIIATIEQRASDNAALRSALDSAARRFEIEAQSHARAAENPAAECERLTQFDLMVNVGVRLSGLRFGVDRSLAVASCSAAPGSDRWRLTKALIANGEIGKAREQLSPAFNAKGNGLTKEVLNQLAKEAEVATEPETLFLIPFLLALEAAEAADPTEEELVAAATTGLLLWNRAAELGHDRAQAIISIAGPYVRDLVKYRQDIADGKASPNSKPEFSGIDLVGVHAAATDGDSLAILALAAFHLVPDVVRIDADPIRIFSADPNSPVKNPEEAVRLVRSAADRGDTIAMVALSVGHLIAEGDIPTEIVPQRPLKFDPAEGVRWLERAAEGEPLAALALAVLFRGELGPPESVGLSADPEKARHWESKLVEAGYAFW